MPSPCERDYARPDRLPAGQPVIGCISMGRQSSAKRQRREQHTPRDARRNLFRRVKSAVVAIAATPNDVSSLAGANVTDSKVFQVVNIVGTGFFVHQSGIVLTARHVIDPWIQPLLNPALSLPPSTLRVCIAFGEGNDGAHFRAQFGIATVANVVANPGFDLAALRIVPPTDRTIFPFIPVAETPCQEGDEIVVCGFPLGRSLHQDLPTQGLMNASFTQGIVSAVLPVSTMPAPLRTLFQIDALVNPGNSGGPVVDSVTGKVVGVISSMTTMDTLVAAMKPNPNAANVYDMAPEKLRLPVGFARATDIHAARTLINDALKPMPAPTSPLQPVVIPQLGSAS